MGKIKQAGVCAGIAVGSVIGGTVSMIGKMTDKRVIDELGENIMDSTILTGEIVGEAASGATNLVAGKIKKQPSKVKKGKKELGSAGGRVVENAVTNVKNVADQSGEILEGIKMKDKKRVAKGLRTLGKMAVVGMLTVGAIKVDEIAEEPSGDPQKDKEEAAGEAAAAGTIAQKAAETGAEADPVPVSEPSREPEAKPIPKPGSEPEEKSVSDLSEPGDKPETAARPEQAVSGGAETSHSVPKRRSGLEAILNVKADSDEETGLSMESLLKKQPSLEEELEKKIRF